MNFLTKTLLVIALMFGGLLSGATEHRSPDANSYTCQINYNGPYGALKLSGSNTNKETLINSLSDQCFEQLRAGSLNANPEDLILECANTVVSGC